MDASSCVPRSEDSRQRIVDGSAQDTTYMVEKTYHKAPYLGAFQAYLMPQSPINGSKGVSIYKNYHCNIAVNLGYLPSGQKTISFGQKRPQQTIWLRKLTI